MMIRHLLAPGLLAVVFSASRVAGAEDPRLHVTAGAARAVGGPQQQELGPGAAAAVALEMPLAKAAGIQVEGSSIWLSQSSAPSDPRLAPHGDGAAFGGMLGGRLRPFGGLWMDVNGGVVHTGNLTRPGFDTHVGYDFALGSVAMGPQLGYTQIFQSNDALRNDDAKILAVGFHVAFGGPSTARPAPPRVEQAKRSDRDGDGVYDDEDACKDERGVRTKDPRTNGCPATPQPESDRDGDGIADSQDACPDEPGRFTRDPATRGCPEPTEIRIVKDEIILDDKIYFEFNVASVRADSVPALQRLAKFLLAHPEIVKVTIHGHADEIGPASYNLWLSQGRAKSVCDVLVAAGVPSARVSAIGFGEERPAAAGIDERARKQNRRVEFLITRMREERGVGGDGSGTTSMKGDH